MKRSYRFDRSTIPVEAHDVELRNALVSLIAALDPEISEETYLGLQKWQRKHWELQEPT